MIVFIRHVDPLPRKASTGGASLARHAMVSGASLALFFVFHPSARSPFFAKGVWHQMMRDPAVVLRGSDPMFTLGVLLLGVGAVAAALLGRRSKQRLD